jgi:hypothetical protein
MAGIVVTKAQWDALLQEDYVMEGIVEAVNKATPVQVEAPPEGHDRGSPAHLSGAGRHVAGQRRPRRGRGDAGLRRRRVRRRDRQAKYNYGTFKVTGPSMEFSTRKAWVEFGDRSDEGHEGRAHAGHRPPVLGRRLGQARAREQRRRLRGRRDGHRRGLGVRRLVGLARHEDDVLLRKNMLDRSSAPRTTTAGLQDHALTATTITISPGSPTRRDNVAIYKKKSKDKEITGFLKFVATRRS